MLSLVGSIMPDKKIHTDYIFPTPIWFADLDIDNQKLLNDCLTIKEKYPEGIKRSNIGGYQFSFGPEYNTGILNDLNDNVVDFTYTLIEECFKPKNFKGITPIHYWLNINYHMNSNFPHVHPNSFLSGVYYVESVPNVDQGCITFYRNKYEEYILSGFDARHHFDNNEFFKTQISSIPIQGRLMIFPSFLLHGVTENLLNNSRVSIAFNIDFKGA